MDRLLQSDPEQLFAELALRHKAILADPIQAGMFETTATSEFEFAGQSDVLIEFGHRFFDRVSKDAFDLVCGTDADNSEERKKLVDAFGLGKTAFAAALAASLVSWFGWAPAIAAVIAALVVRLFFKNAYGAMCEVWKERLPS